MDGRVDVKLKKGGLGEVDRWHEYIARHILVGKVIVNTKEVG